MNFTEPIFLIFFFIVMILLWRAKKSHRWQIYIVLVASYIFYGWWSARFLWLIFISTLIDYICGLIIGKSDNILKRKIFLLASLCSNLGILAFFKYYNFFIDNANHLLSLFGYTNFLPQLHIILPVGISFYTFQTMSYTIDVYRKKLEYEPNFIRFSCYVAAFPQLVAGPIVRAIDFLPQLQSNFMKHASHKGYFRILYGFFKKLIIADYIAITLVDKVFAHPEKYSSLEILLAVYAYALQIFMDFSAYSDIAIGIGMMMGLQFPENFKSPYLSKDPSEFWQRWHISLSSWLKDYLYISLGGNRNGKNRTMINLMITMLLGGLWHGASWNFVIWGGLHGFYLIIYRMLSAHFVSFTYESSKTSIWYWIQRLLFFHLVCFAWIFFRSSDFSQALEVIKGLFDFHYVGDTLIRNSLTTAISLIICGYILHDILDPNLERVSLQFYRLPAFVQALIIFILGIFIFNNYHNGINQQAFIYFQF